MKKIAIGCAIVALIGMAALGVGAYLAYRAARPMITAAGDYIAKAREFSLGDRIVNKSPYQAPADARLNASQVERFVAVHRTVKTHLGSRWSEFQKRAADFQQRADKNQRLTFSDLTGLLSDFGSLYLEARRAQVDALNTHKFSEDEYFWVRMRVYEAAGVSLANGIDTHQFEQMVREQSGVKDLDVPAIPTPDVAEENLRLVKPHLDDLKETLALALLGL